MQKKWKDDIFLTQKIHSCIIIANFVCLSERSDNIFGGFSLLVRTSICQVRAAKLDNTTPKN